MKTHLADLSVMVEDFSLIISRDEKFENVFYDIGRELEPDEISFISVFITNDLPEESEEILHIQGSGYVTVGSTSFDYGYFHFPPGEVDFTYRQINDVKGEITFFGTDMDDVALIRQEYLIVSSEDKLWVRIGDKVINIRVRPDEEVYTCALVLVAESDNIDGDPVVSVLQDNSQYFISHWKTEPHIDEIRRGIIV